MVVRLVQYVIKSLGISVTLARGLRSIDFKLEHPDKNEELIFVMFVETSRLTAFRALQPFKNATGISVTFANIERSTSSNSLQFSNIEESSVTLLKPGKLTDVIPPPWTPHCTSY